MVYILPLRHPLEVAKTVGNVALFSGGRISLGVGAGWIKEEFDALGVPFAKRGKRMNEMIDVMRKCWSGEMIEHRGEVFELGPLQMSPAPAAPPPILVGGISKIALKRAATRGDGWLGTGQTPDEAAQFCDALAALRQEAGRADAPFETIIPLVTPPEVDTLKRLEAEHGMTASTAYPFTYTVGPGSTVAQKRDAMMRFGDQVIAKLR